MKNIVVFLFVVTCITVSDASAQLPATNPAAAANSSPFYTGSNIPSGQGQWVNGQWITGQWINGQWVADQGTNNKFMTGQGMTGQGNTAGKMVPGQSSDGQWVNGQWIAVPVPLNHDLQAPTSSEPGKPVVPAEVATMPSAIERSMAEKPVTADKSQSQQQIPDQITQFGYNFFKPEAAGFAPLTDIPVGSDYIIGAGDRLIITLWGSIDGTFELEVSRSGEVVLPKVGSVKVAGQTYGQLPALLNSSLARVFKDFHLNVNMGKIRAVKVYVVGEVAAPGDYNLSSLSTLINALSAAGGPTRNGSLRKIQINRSGKLIETVDLYDFFLKGDKGRDIRLQAGDTVFVPVIGPVVGVSGNVRRPAIYELKGEQSLKDVLQLSGGINPNGYLQRIQIYRVEAHDKKIVTDLNFDLKGGKNIADLTSSIPVQDLDLVKILPIDSILHDYVRLEGNVLRPGNYALKPGMRLSDLLKVDTLLPEYYTTSGQLTRLVPPDMHPEVTLFDLSRAMKGEAPYDLQLKEFDVVKVFAQGEMEEIPTVRVSGEVQNPGQFRLYPHMTVRDLLMLSGNLKLTAYMKNAEISRLKRSGDSVTSYSLLVNLDDVLKGGGGNPELEPFDELNVRRIPNWAEEADRYITLKGEFLFPGVYPVYKGERLSSVISRAGGFTDKAYLSGTKFTRTLVQELQQKRMAAALSKAEADLNQKQSELATAASKEELEANKTALAAMMNSLNILKQSKAEGRLVIKLSQSEQLKGGEYDLEVNGGDMLEVPPNPQMVAVLGQVYNPTSFVYRSGEDLDSYLNMAGGTTRDAETDDIYVIKADGTVVSRQASSSGFFGFGGFMAKNLDSGDTVVVPQKLEKTAWMREIKDIATILGQVALTAGVLIAAGL